ncbi:MAG: flagellar biosynthesis anti-sigma factor FlgM [Bryobacteraceae bacterium]|jgi:flagellar biosynthesis anti-sigma factor FlgM
MRIDDNQLSGIGPAAAGASQNVRSGAQQGASTAKPGEGATGKDEVRLSAVADQVGNLKTTPERAAKIAELAKLVQSGQYNPHPEKVADSIIDDMLSGSGSS